jgi:hypothetical protein
MVYQNGDSPPGAPSHNFLLWTFRMERAGYVFVQRTVRGSTGTIYAQLWDQRTNTYLLHLVWSAQSPRQRRDTHAEALSRLLQCLSLVAQLLGCFELSWCHGAGAAT